MNKTLILIRGIPGGGKSTLAKQLAQGATMHFEADKFFVDRETGEYRFDGMRIGEAHQWCQDQTSRWLQYSSVIVSNTFTRLKEMRPYFEIAKELGVPAPVVYIAQGGFKNVHGVPDHVLENMRKRFEYDVSPLYREFYPEMYA